MPVISRRALIKLAAAGFLAGVGAVSYPFMEAFARPRITRYTLNPVRWSPGLVLRIAVIADIHACRPWMDRRRITGICQQAQALNADLILLLGDFMPGMHRLAEPLPPRDWVEPLASLTAPLGVHAVLGNHDYWSDDDFQRDPTVEPMVARVLAEAGIAVHVNHAVRLSKDGQAFWLAGLGDQIAILPKQALGETEGRGIEDMAKTLAHVSDDAPVILMAHEPDVFLEPHPRISLTLSGHTHGGQVNLFGWRPVNASRGSARYPAGLFRKGESDLIVSKGLGCSSLPMRIGSWPEILHIELGAA
ncbi:metallophosphoesterase [Rhizobium helianthi]|uniref:Metallophosphoesterase n=1 Tax=Rhizobium helianthi TaxID=1132695 RepID=A0ABW4M490_9HYPH